MSAVITLTTDFGYGDGYAAVMKAVILSINPAARLVDITHSIKRQDIKETAFILSTIYPYFPEDTIHLVITDPGVGTGRKAVILKTPSAYFIAPDNGVLSYVIRDYADKSQVLNMASAMEAVVISNTQYFRQPVSNTFQGRDIFAPAAAYLSLGTPFSEFGKPLDSLTTFDLPRPRLEANGSLTGEIIHIDSFGNLITCFREKDLPGKGITITTGGKIIRGLSTSYAATRKLTALIGSSGYLEIAVKNGSAAEYLGASEGDQVNILNRNMSKISKL